jgi:peptidoglycan/xylan/chitin deacetylase (PgdA/CDA1 family)
MKLTIIMYHYVRELSRSRYPSIKGLDLPLFLRQLEFLTANYAVVRMEDVLAAPDGGALPENAALLTFDDGYSEHYTTVFPILDEMGIQGSFFPPSVILETERLLDVNKIHFILAAGEAGSVFKTLLEELDFHRGIEFQYPENAALLDEYAKPSRFDTAEVIFIKRILQTALPERLRAVITDRLFQQFVGVDEAVFARELYCDVRQMRAMKRHGMFIGLHGSAHEWLGNLGKDAYEADISRALAFMDGAGLLDRNAWVMNYPYGSYNDGVVEYIRANGCKMGLSTRVAAADLRTDDRLLLPRLDTNDFPPKSEEYRKYI